MQPNTALFVVTYLLLMAPTYILPYFGSNSSIINAASAIIGWGMLPQWWLHAGTLGLLCCLSWARGGVVSRPWLPVLPILAGCFDLLPFLSAIPFIPTLLHIGGILCGVIGTQSNSEDAAQARQAALNRKALIGSGLIAGIVAVGIAAFYSMPKKSLPLPVSPATPASVPKPAQASDSKNSVSIPPAPTKTPMPQKSTTKPQKPAKTETPANSGTTMRYIKIDD
jgi:hypothetical protein